MRFSHRWFASKSHGCRNERHWLTSALDHQRIHMSLRAKSKNHLLISFAVERICGRVNDNSFMLFDGNPSALFGVCEESYKRKRDHRGECCVNNGADVITSRRVYLLIRRGICLAATCIRSIAASQHSSIATFQSLVRWTHSLCLCPPEKQEKKRQSQATWRHQKL